MDGERKKKSPLFWGVGILLVLLLYVGSIGPVLVLLLKSEAVLSQQQMEWIVKGYSIFYYPLFYVGEHNHTLGECMSWYADLWCSKIFHVGM